MRHLVRRSLVAGALLVLLASPSAGESRREQSVGVAPIVPGTGVPRDAAMRAAVAAAVLRTAQELLPTDFAPPEPGLGDDGMPETPEAWLAERLGDDPFAYVSRFRILEDRGRRPAMFATEPGVEEEYVVLADVSVDVEAVADRLATLGLPVAGPQRALRSVTLVIEGLSGYRPLALLRDALRDDRGVSAVVPVEFTPGRAVLAVEADRGAPGLIEALRASGPEGLQIVVVEQRDDGATLLVDWRPPVAFDAEAARSDAD